MSFTPPSVLAVDNEPDICSLIEDGLKTRDISCQTTTSSIQALSLIQQRHYDVVISDISMPEMNGLQLAKAIHQSQPEIRIILITGMTDYDYMADALKLGAFEYFNKPFDIRQLAESVCNAVLPTDAAQGLTGRAARAIRQSSEAKQIAFESIRALAQAVEAKDFYTRRHSEQVAHYAMHLAEYMSVDLPLREAIHVAALLHDIGKIGVPDHVLTKPGPLTKEEQAMIRSHPILGAEILSHISVFSIEADLVRHHHERWDGRGYPDELSGEKIPLGARIINVADCIDAMLMKRTYKPALSVETMLAELRRCACSQFDPVIASAAAEWCGKYPHKLITSLIPN